MKRGKQTCRILKEIRRQIAEANDIEFITSECQYKGDCFGTCPKCEAEVRYLEQELERRRMTGKLVTLAGISAGMLTMNTYAQSGGSNSTVAPLSQIEIQDKASSSEKEITIGYILIVPIQSDTSKVDATDEAMEGVIETMPEFPGGMEALTKYIADNLEYPKEMIEARIQGRVVVQTTVEKDGSIHSEKVLKSVHPRLDAEALRIIDKMPRWKPGALRGKPTKVKYIIPVTFSLPIVIKGSIKAEQDNKKDTTDEF